MTASALGGRLVRGLLRAALAPLQRGPLTSQAIVRRAGELPGLPSEAWLLRLEVLVAAIEEKRPTALGRALLERGLSDALTNMVRVQRAARLLPASHEPAPIVIVGLQRTGTTFLHHLLARDPRLRALRLWELLTPTPGTPAAVRRRLAKAAVLGNALINPESRLIHPLQIDAPEECWYLFAHALGTLCYDFHWDLPSVRQHLDRPEVRRELYDLYRQQLDVLRAGDERPLVLKGPDHLWNLAELVSVLPRARLVWCHRDPLASIPSFCSLSSLHRRAIFGRVDRAAIGRHVLATFARGLERALAFRAAHPEVVIHDVDYRALVSAPRLTVERLYAACGLTFTPLMAQAIAAEVAATRRLVGQHRYDLGYFGLSAEHVERELGAYRRHLEEVTSTLPPPSRRGSPPPP